VLVVAAIGGNAIAAIEQLTVLVAAMKG